MMSTELMLITHKPYQKQTHVNRTLLPLVSDVKESAGPHPCSDLWAGGARWVLCWLISVQVSAARAGRAQAWPCGLLDNSDELPLKGSAFEMMANSS